MRTTTEKALEQDWGQNVTQVDDANFRLLSTVVLTSLKNAWAGERESGEINNDTERRGCESENYSFMLEIFLCL